MPKGKVERDDLSHDWIRLWAGLLLRPYMMIYDLTCDLARSLRCGPCAGRPIQENRRCNAKTQTSTSITLCLIAEEVCLPLV